MRENGDDKRAGRELGACGDGVRDKRLVIKRLWLGGRRGGSEVDDGAPKEKAESNARAQS